MIFLLLTHSCLNARKLTELAAKSSSDNVIFFAGIVRFAEKIYILVLFAASCMFFYTIRCAGYAFIYIICFCVSFTAVSYFKPTLIFAKICKL